MGCEALHGILLGHDRLHLRVPVNKVTDLLDLRNSGKILNRSKSHEDLHSEKDSVPRGCCFQTVLLQNVLLTNVFINVFYLFLLGCVAV